MVLIHDASDAYGYQYILSSTSMISLIQAQCLKYPTPCPEGMSWVVYILLGACTTHKKKPWVPASAVACCVLVRFYSRLRNMNIN